MNTVGGAGAAAPDARLSAIGGRFRWSPYRIATYARTKLNVTDQAGQARVRASRGAAANDNCF